MSDSPSSRPPGLAGSLLLAHPKLRDPNFTRSVVLLSVHNREGAMGVVLNRPLGRQLAELGAAFAEAGLGDIPLYRGGPVGGEQLILAAWETLPGGEGCRLYFGLEPGQLARLREERPVEARAFLGYSGWSGGQLEQEMARNTWLVTPMPSAWLGDVEGVDLWRALLARLGPGWRLQAGEPEDPSVN